MFSFPGIKLVGVLVGVAPSSNSFAKVYFPMQKFLKMLPRTSSVEILLARGARTILWGGR